MDIDRHRLVLPLTIPALDEQNTQDFAYCRFMETTDE